MIAEMMPAAAVTIATPVGVVTWVVPSDQVVDSV